MTTLKNKINSFKFEGYHGSTVDPAIVELVRRSSDLTYNRAIAEAIVEEVGPVEIERDLDRLVYICRQIIKDEKQAEQDKAMIALGWRLIKDVGDYRGPAVLNATKDIDWLTSKIVDLPGKIITSGNGLPFFIPKGKRSRGYYLTYGSIKGYWKPQ